MTSNWDKFVLLLWKNFLIHKRHRWRTCFEIGLPILVFSIVLMLPSKPHTVGPKRYPSLSVDGGDGIPDHLRQLAYSPNNAVVEEIVSKACAILGISQCDGFNSGLEMQTAMVNSSYLCGVDFGDHSKTLSKVSNATTFKLRFPSELRYSSYGEPPSDWNTKQLSAPFTVSNYNPESIDGGPPHYWHEHFLAVQAAISRVLVAKMAPTVQLPRSMNVQRFPYPTTVDNDLFVLLPYMLSNWLRLVFMYFFINSVKYIALEKERQLKESMKLMGLPGWIQWGAWFVELLLMTLIPVTAITIMLKVSIFPYSTSFLIWTFLTLYCSSLICLCFLLSVFFNKATRAATLASLLWIASFVSLPSGAPYWSKIVYSLLPNPAMGFGMDDIVRLETAGVGLTWQTLFKQTEMKNPYSLSIAVAMLLSNILLYLLLTIYLEQVMPGKYGVAKPWYFPFTKDFWSRQSSADVDLLLEPTERSKYFEEETQFRASGVQIRNLRKVYGSGKVAVDGLSLNLYEGQITVLLGHNGAGKTTTMSMLTGMFSPSSGTALINGYDIRRRMDEVRGSMGFCPQHNVLFDELTVHEHLQFAARLKGIRSDEVRSQVDRYINRLGLMEKARAEASTLSGGMKRKLSVGMAMCGNPKVVLLDEPSTGVDPTARHALWDFLHEEKRDKTVLLSTHYMNEADVLGDRIAILADGKLSASGSPFFLKNAFGVGYRLICVKGRKYSEACLLETLRKHIPSVKIDHESASEVEVLLEKKYVQRYEAMLEEMERNMESCGVMSYGVSFTTLEEVFMKAGTESHNRSHDEGSRLTDHSVHLDTRAANEPNSLLISSNNLKSSALAQIKAQFLKKFLCTKRSWIQFCWTTFVVPVVIMILVAFPIQIRTNNSLPPLEMSLATYDNSFSVVEGSNSKAVHEYQRLFQDGQELEVLKTDTESYILQKYNGSILEYNSRLLVGASFSNDFFTGWFNAKNLHSAPLALNLMFNAVLRTVCPSCSITTVNHPLPRQNDKNGDNTDNGDFLHHLNIIIAIMFIMAYVPSSYVTFYIRERVNRVKLLQVVSGLRTELYWFVSILWDLVAFMVCCLVILTMLFGYQVDGWSDPQALSILLFIFLIFALATLPMIYLISFTISNPASGYSRVLLIIGIGAIGLLLVRLLFIYIEFNKLADLIGYGFMFIPTISLGLVFDKFSTYTSTVTTCNNFCNLLPNCTMDVLCKQLPKCCSPYSDLFSFTSNGMLRELSFMLVTGVVCFLLIWAIERKLFHRLWAKVYPSKDYRYTVPQPQMDSDVLLEKSRISQMTDTDIAAHSLVLRNLTKNYGPISAVKWLSLGTQPSECFGLLGVNGAGKTTTFRMMTGDESISFGDVWINGVNVKSNLAQAYQHVGYCPQFDGLLDELTGLETLRIFAMLRGIPGIYIDSVVRSHAEELGLTMHLDKPIREYSGGTKRKLSTALALIGNPSVIFLDEPTSGMDPGAKRQLWNVINRLRDAGRTIILTTHSMDECEALCTRLAIMVNGEFKCLGSTQHLKNKFSGGFLLHIKMLQAPSQVELQIRMAAVKAFVAERFRDAVLKEELQNSLSYHIPRSELTWSAMFGIMEASKEVLAIEEYSLGQTTLEQVFLVFANSNSW
ncbi:ATP-binding cassette sub-family A member 1 [Aedes aegypti]|uniref:ABC transporter domain-containing protein n=1 Tax=Aedes aegypti TaxID=7159 RepID=A0A1S4FWU1_AEDAE|nr:ATP-binding cassette sub-family A member 1 [Aedes aegypti]